MCKNTMDKQYIENRITGDVKPSKSQSYNKSTIKDKVKESSGITIITLVVTILIIIILAGVTINATLGDDGLLRQAQLAKDMAENSTLTESEKMNKLAQEYANMMTEDEEIEQPKGLTAADVKADAENIYGKILEGYSTDHSETSGAVTTWRIFYADESNIYIIADDYISSTNAPDGKGGSAIYENSEYKLSFNNIIDDYAGASAISTSNPARKWIDTYLNSYGSSTNNNIKAVAYMMDTDVWSVYEGSQAEYAIGGPTLELFCASYQDTHPSRYLQCDSVNSTGYQIKWSDGSYGTYVSGLTQDDYNSIYIKSDTSKAYGVWLASPPANGSYGLFDAYFNGNVGNSRYDDSNLGLRPLVCLKSSVQIERVDSDTFRIVS